MGDRNLFAIGRSRLGPEDQLTEMLAYLWQERPDLPGRWLQSLGLDGADDVAWQVATQVAEPRVGRFDMTLEIPGEALVIVESKLDAELTNEQLGRYMAHLASRPEPSRTLVALAKHPSLFGDGLAGQAQTVGVGLIFTRWQDLAAAIADPVEEGVAGDFVRMLIEEGLVMPQALGADDWDTWNRGAAVLARLRILLTEARKGMSALSPDLRPNTQWGSDDRWIYSGYRSEQLEIGLGFSANESSQRPLSPPIIWAYMRNRLLAPGEAKRRAAEAAGQVLGGAVMWSNYVARFQSAADVLTGSDFREQVAQAVRFAYTVAVQFRECGYLPQGLVLNEPTPAPPGPRPQS